MNIVATSLEGQGTFPMLEIVQTYLESESIFSELHVKRLSQKARVHFQYKRLYRIIWKAKLHCQYKDCGDLFGRQDYISRTTYCQIYQEIKSIFSILLMLQANIAGKSTFPEARVNFQYY